MPNEKETRSCCIICGRPSTTVVCMRCYFNYDYRTYNNHKLEQSFKSFSSEAQPSEPKDDSFLAEWEKEFEHMQHDNELDDIEVYKEEPEKEESWFARFPRFFDRS